MVEVDMVDGDRAHPHQRLAGLRCRLWRLFMDEDLGRAELVEPGDLHRFSLIGTDPHLFWFTASAWPRTPRRDVATRCISGCGEAGLAADRPRRPRSRLSSASHPTNPFDPARGRARSAFALRAAKRPSTEAPGS